MFLGLFVLDLWAKTCQTYAPRDIATLTFDLAGNSPSRRYGSSSSICTPSLKFVGFSVRKIWHTSGLNIMSAYWPWLLPLTLKLVRVIARRVENLPTNFGISRTFQSRPISQHLSDASRDLATFTFDLGGHGACSRCGSSCSILFTKFDHRRFWPRDAGIENKVARFLWLTV